MFCPPSQSVRQCSLPLLTSSVSVLTDLLHLLHDHPHLWRGCCEEDRLLQGLGLPGPPIHHVSVPLTIAWEAGRGWVTAYIHRKVTSIVPVLGPIIGLTSVNSEVIIISSTAVLRLAISWQILISRAPPSTLTLSLLNIYELNLYFCV